MWHLLCQVIYYFGIPFAFGTIVGLGAVALENTPRFPAYPKPLTQEEVSSGLILPYMSQAAAGKGGAAAILLVLFMTSTSVTSTQLIAVSSILTFDIYRTYINPQATNKQLIRVTHITVVGFSIVVSSFATGLHEGGVDLNWILYMIGIIVCPGTFPTCFALLWRGQTKTAAIVSPIAGMACGFAVWFSLAYHYSGIITIASLGDTMPCLFATITSMFVPLPVSLILSCVKPGTYKWDFAQRIHRADDSGPTGDTTSETSQDLSPSRVKYMKRMSRIAAGWAIFTVVGHILLWPLPMYGARIIFSRSVRSNSPKRCRHCPD